MDLHLHFYTYQQQLSLAYEPYNECMSHTDSVSSFWFVHHLFCQTLHWRHHMTIQLWGLGQTCKILKS